MTRTRTIFTCDQMSFKRCVVCRWKWLEGHAALSPKSNFKGQGIHKAISLDNLRDMHHWKTPLVHHLNCALPIEISLCDANMHTLSLA